MQTISAGHYAEYAAWFVDPELNCHLGPMDEAWLKVVLSQPEERGITWALLSMLHTFRSTILALSVIWKGRVRTLYIRAGRTRLHRVSSQD